MADDRRALDDDDDEALLSGLLDEGRAVFRGAPEARQAAIASRLAVRRLAGAFDTYRLEIAGPAIAFEAGIACEAAGLVRAACWALVGREDRAGDLKRRLRLSRPPSRPADHLSADLTLRYLPQVFRRARSLDPSDPLAAILEEVLRAWPLSGVLADLDGGPSPPADLGGHPGLWLLYAERFAAGRDRPGWRPPAPALPYLELVLGEGR